MVMGLVIVIHCSLAALKPPGKLQHGCRRSKSSASEVAPSSRTAIADRIELVQYVENLPVLGRVRTIAEGLIGPERLLEALDDVVLLPAGSIVADQRSGRTGRGRDELAVDDPVMLAVKCVGEDRFREKREAVLLRQGS